MLDVLDLEKEFLLIQDNLKSYLYRLSANRSDTEDLVHDTFIKVKEKIGTFKGKSSFKSWVFAIATNLAKDSRKVRKRWADDVQDICKNYTMSHKECELRILTSYNNQKVHQFEIVEHMNYCFVCLAKNLELYEQIAIILKEIYQFKRQDIAEILEITEGKVKHLLLNARKKLQEKYEHRCAMINKNGICYQCAELNDYLQDVPDSHDKISKFGFSEKHSHSKNLDIRFNLINKVNPLNGNGASVEDTIFQILNEALGDE